MTDELIVDPPAESVVIDYLTAVLAARGDSARVSSKPLEGRCVRVIRTGGAPTVARVLTKPVLTIETKDVLESSAEQLAALVGALVRQMRGTVQLVGELRVTIAEVSQVGSIVNLPDPLDDRPRYSQSLQVNMKAAAE